MTRDFTSAAGVPALTPLYDLAISALTRESVWRGALLAHVRPAAGDRILDVGCGTGTFAVMLKQAAPGCSVTGLDPDPEILVRARAKAIRAGVSADFVHGYARDADRNELRYGKIVSSLVFHQVPMAEKAAGLAAMRRALEPGGSIYVADYGLQRTRLMRTLFKTIQQLDGVENTEPNARGVLPELMVEAGFRSVAEHEVIPILTGSISIYTATSPEKDREP